MKEVQIIPFEDQYATHFASLNLEWIKHYFAVEPMDEELLLNCKNSIIAPGGYIFFAKIDEDVVGTFALIKIADGVFELGKMGISPEYRGYKIGQKLLQFCVAFAQQQSWEKLVLYTNTILENAIHIYKKNGFEQVPVEENTEYKRSNVKMELKLTK